MTKPLAQPIKPFKQPAVAMTTHKQDVLCGFLRGLTIPRLVMTDQQTEPVLILLDRLDWSNFTIVHTSSNVVACELGPQYSHHQQRAHLIS